MTRRRMPPAYPLLPALEVLRRLRASGAVVPPGFEARLLALELQASSPVPNVYAGVPAYGGAHPCRPSR
jgi:hypothetical protein